FLATPAFFIYCSVFRFHCSPSTKNYPLSLHDALPISCRSLAYRNRSPQRNERTWSVPKHRLGVALLVPEPGDAEAVLGHAPCSRSEEHTSELQSHLNLVCRLLLEKKNTSTRARRSAHT